MEDLEKNISSEIDVREKFYEAVENVESIYDNLTSIANTMILEIIQPIDDLVEEIGSDINSLTVDELKNKMYSLQFNAFRLVEIKEKTAWKSELAIAVQKEKFSMEFNQAEGTAVVKTNAATIKCSEQILVQTLYEYISNRLKSKVDQLHRLVDCMKSILMARMQEAKLALTGVQ